MIRGDEPSTVKAPEAEPRADERYVAAEDLTLDDAHEAIQVAVQITRILADRRAPGIDGRSLSLCATRAEESLMWLLRGRAIDALQQQQEAAS